MLLARRTDRSLRETIYAGTLANGLRVLFLPRPGTARIVGLLGADFGSNDVAWTPPGSAGPATLPAGTAHFLEHMQFLKADGDLTQAFTRAGAQCNAATDHISTVYSFTSAGRFPENLPLLARLVTEFHADEAQVAREREVIGQELKMYLDTPDVKAFQGLLECLYHLHPVRVDPAGTLESIAAIDGPTLAQAHAAFYVPGNLRLAIAGDLTPEAVYRAASECLANGRPARPRPERLACAEPRAVRTVAVEAAAPASCAKVLLGLKDPRPPRAGAEAFAIDAATAMVLELVLGAGSDLYSRLYREGVADESFSAGFSCHPSFAFSVIGGDTDNAGRFRDRVAVGLRAARKAGIHKRDFERVRRKFLGRAIQRLDDAEAAAWLAWNHDAVGIDLLDAPRLLRRVTLADCRRRLEEHLDPDGPFAAWSVVRPG